MKIRDILIAVICLCFSACEKKPQPGFTADQEIYQGGDTINLTNASKSGSTFEWHLPNRETVSTETAKYVIENNIGFTTLNIGLTVKSKGHCKRSSISKGYRVIPQSYFRLVSNSNGSVYLYSVLPFVLKSFANMNKVTAQIYKTQTNDVYTYNVFFAPGSSPPAGTYTLDVNSTNLPAFVSHIQMLTDRADGADSVYEFDTGQLNVEYIGGTLHISFSNVTSTTSNYTLDGNVYVPL